MISTLTRIARNLCYPKSYLSLALFILLALSPITIRNPFVFEILIMTIIYAALSSSWNLIGGYGGQLSLGHAAFFGIGAYTSTLLFLNFGISPWLGMVGGGVIAAIFSAFVGYPCFRLRGPFFALATIALAEVLRMLALYWRSLTQGGVGLLIPYKPEFKNLLFGDKISYAYVALAFLAVVVLVTVIIENSRLGYYLVAIREDEDAAETLGVSSAQCKLIALAISAFFTAMLGTLYAQYVLFIDPDIVFPLVLSIHFALLAIIGGVGTVAGPILGAVLLTPLDAFLRGWLGALYAGLGFIVYGILLIVVVILLPEGIIKWLREKIKPTLNKLPVIRLEAFSLKEPLEEKAPALAKASYEKNGTVLLGVKNVSKYFGGLAAVNDVQFDIRKGEILGLIGPNGSGKTTMFNLITAFLPLNSGIIEFKNTKISHFKCPSKVCSLGIGRTFQLVKPFNNMTVLENVMIGAFCRSNNVEDVRREAMEIIEIVGMSDHKDYLASNLNVNYRKRLELARALATKPEVLLLDEPMAGLNPKETEEMIELLKKISSRGITLLIIEHIMKAIMTLSDRIMVLHHGEKIAEGTPQEISKDQKVIDAYLGEEYVYATSG
jgi:branched-chain amino acid transport system permease protein